MYYSRHGNAGRQGKARQGKARQGKARQGKARQGKARQDDTFHANAVIPAKAGIHFDLDGRNMDSRFRGNDDR
jgi:hypothetical protein